MKPRSEAKRNGLRGAFHNPPKSRSLASVIDELDEWEKTVEQFELLECVLSESDMRTILLKKLPTTVPSSMVSSFRRFSTYIEMKAELESEIVLLKDYGPGVVHRTGHAQLAAEQALLEDEDQQDGTTAGEDEEGILELDLSGLPAEQAEPILLAARQAGLRVRAPFRRPSSGNKFQPRPKAKIHPRVPTPPRSGERETKRGNCGGLHATRECPNPLLEEGQRKCFNCGETGHRANNCKKPDRRNQQHGGKALLVGPHREHLLGVLGLDSSSPVPIPIGDIPRREPGSQSGAKRRQKLFGMRS